jgi:hypothetical protein
VVELIERAYFAMCLQLGRMLRSARYSKVQIVERDGELKVRKHRAFYAPILVWLGGFLIRVLDTGVRVLPQREWETRERQLYLLLHDMSIEVDLRGVLVLPHYSGQTLATLLDDPNLDARLRKKAIELAVVALTELHRLGRTHGDAMAENVLVDLDADVARWIDFENAHDARRPMAWRRADDVRALLTTCLDRSSDAEFAETLEHILDFYDDERVSSLLVDFTAVLQRPLTLHLGQAGLSFRRFRAIAQLMRERQSSARKRLPHSVVITR